MKPAMLKDLKTDESIMISSFDSLVKAIGDYKFNRICIQIQFEPFTIQFFFVNANGLQKMLAIQDPSKLKWVAKLMDNESFARAYESTIQTIHSKDAWLVRIFMKESTKLDPVKTLEDAFNIQ